MQNGGSLCENMGTGVRDRNPPKEDSNSAPVPFFISCSHDNGRPFRSLPANSSFRPLYISRKKFTHGCDPGIVIGVN